MLAALFLKVFHSCPERVKAQAYTSLVRPILEYGSTAWDPYRMYKKKTGSNKYNVLHILLLKHIPDRKDVLPKH